ncbi:MAG: uracil phosphoribosyltransferase [Polaribacter sp.]|jgi:uracil phosphoribosyltransferase
MNLQKFKKNIVKRKMKLLKKSKVGNVSFQKLDPSTKEILWYFFYTSFLYLSTSLPTVKP